MGISFWRVQLCKESSQPGSYTRKNLVPFRFVATFNIVKFSRNTLIDPIRIDYLHRLPLSRGVLLFASYQLFIKMTKINSKPFVTTVIPFYFRMQILCLSISRR